MKTELGRSRRSYRNEVVFRSAQQLIASRPQAAVRTFKGWVLVLGGLALLIVGIFIGRNWSHTHLPIIDPPSMHADAVAAASDARSRNISNTDGLRLKPLAPQATSRIAVNSVTLEGISADGISSPEARPTSLSADATASMAVPFVTSITVSKPLLTLRGSLDADNQASLAVEFSLHVHDRSVTGVVRYLSPDDKRLAANRVSGTIIDRVVEIRESDSIWTTPLGVSDHKPAWRDFGRVFVFELPKETKGISGRWTFGATQGTVSLDLASPW